MFVVKTTSATVVGAASRKAPRKRVPSSSRRNPGVKLRSVTRLWRFRLRRRRRLRAAGLCCAACASCGLRLNGQDVCVRPCRSGSCWRRWRAEGLIENRTRCGAPRGRQRQKKREAEKNSAAPPARFCQEITRLTRPEDRIGGAGDATKAGRQAAAFTGLF